MKVVTRDSQILVVDDFLPEPDAVAVRKAFQKEPFKFVHVPDVRMVYRVGDGNPLEGSAVMQLTQPLDRLLPGLDAPPEEELPFFLAPTGKPIDVLLDAVRQLAREVPGLVGTEGNDWIALQGKPFVYPPGTGLSWHDDGTIYTAAFTYYVHPRWHSQWGGEVLVANEATDLPPWRPHAFFEEPNESDALLEQGLGRYILPKPNRLFLLRGGVYHRVAPVANCAGDNVRATIAGFFVRKEGLSYLLSGGRY